MIKFKDNKQNCWQSWHTIIHIKIISNTLVTTFGPFYSQKRKFSKKLSYNTCWNKFKKIFFLKWWFFKHLKDPRAIRRKFNWEWGKNPLNQKSSFLKKELKYISDAAQWSVRKTNYSKNTLLEIGMKISRSHC